MNFHSHRSLRRPWFGLILALSAFLPTSAVASDRRKPPSVKRRPPAQVRRAKPPRVGGRADIELYKLGPQEFRALETQEMLTIARKMYQFDEARAAGVYNEISRMQAERWDGNAALQPYVDLISRRQQAYKKLLYESQRAGRAEVSVAELRRNREFKKILRDVRLFERRHRYRFADALDRIEPLLEPAEVEEAHRQWRRRASIFRSTIKVRGLVEGLSSKQFKKSAPAAARPKASDPKAAKARPGPAKPPSGQAGSKRGSGKTVRSRRAPKRGQASARPLSDWEKYVRDFIKRYELTPSQTNAALSILKEMKLRAVQTEKANRNAKAAAEKIAEAHERRRRLSELNMLVDDLFHQLDQRLENLLTAAQRRMTPNK